MNCKNCEYAIKSRSLQDNEWYTRCTYEEGECVKIAELEVQIKKMRCLLNEIYSEFGFSELVRIRNDLPLEVQDVIKEIKEND